MIAGGGPNGLMLACELALAGVRPVVLERLTAPRSEQRANGLVGQVVRMMDRRGLYERLSGSAGPPLPAPQFMFAAFPMPFGRAGRQPRLHAARCRSAGSRRCSPSAPPSSASRSAAAHELVGLAPVRRRGHGGGRRAGRTVPRCGRATWSARTAGTAHPQARRHRLPRHHQRQHRRQDRPCPRARPDSVDPASGGLTVPGYGVIPAVPAHPHRARAGVLRAVPGRPRVDAERRRTRRRRRARGR